MNLGDFQGAANIFALILAKAPNAEVYFTSVGHLAGALAKPVWVLVPFLPDWRWLLNRDDNHWYPAARLFRQDDMRSWDKFIVHVRATMQTFIARKSS
jgi:hypothetical protein